MEVGSGGERMLTLGAERARDDETKLSLASLTLNSLDEDSKAPFLSISVHAAMSLGGDTSDIEITELSEKDFEADGKEPTAG